MTTSNHAWPVREYTPRHESWPYTEADFARQDPSPDSSFYAAPRFVTHIDDSAIARLREYYDTVLPRKGRILDFCSSWISHYPKDVEDAAARGDAKVIGLGMNKAELDANAMLNDGRVLADLNVDADVGRALTDASVLIASEDEKLDASTNTVSIDYLTRPVEVLASVRGATKVGGSVHLAISNRCFPTKAIARWLRVNETEKLMMVGDFLHFAGWRRIEIVDLCDNSQTRGGFAAWMGLSADPLWVVRAVKE